MGEESDVQKRDRDGEWIAAIQQHVPDFEYDEKLSPEENINTLFDDFVELKIHPHRFGQRVIGRIS